MREPPVDTGWAMATVRGCRCPGAPWALVGMAASYFRRAVGGTVETRGADGGCWLWVGRSCSIRVPPRPRPTSGRAAAAGRTRTPRRADRGRGRAGGKSVGNRQSRRFAGRNCSYAVFCTTAHKQETRHDTGSSVSLPRTIHIANRSNQNHARHARHNISLQRRQRTLTSYGAA